jgi:hypothetical protein
VQQTQQTYSASSALDSEELVAQMQEQMFLPEQTLLQPQKTPFAFAA